MGDLDLPNRIVMAPLTRMRAGSIDHVPIRRAAASGGELPSHVVGGHIILGGI